ncbi:transglycosylase domain-containing protein [Cellulomonas sp.]|uniref:transglycosylase domain-containing protein n=1 Tax=Cellulomonas sp. TaxID=40001 RepID=UPI002D40D700|nr:transglycosylase domain-containing protein [Cellulomonas sp.]HYQ76770.1 transglycosylase domain-containing protein [Cellulomonas sp.]
MAPSPSPRGRQVTVVQALALLLAFVLTAGVGGLLTAGLVLPTVAVANTATDLSVEAFEDLPSELETKPLSEKSVMLANDGTTVLAEFFSENRVVVPLDQVSVQMQNAVVATEDKRFYQHGGIDPAGMVRALVKNQISDSTQGASTLTQQYVKNVLIETAVRDGDLAAAEAAREAEGTEGYARKLREAKLAIALEKTMTKDQILENYLNIAQFGVATYGVESAALRYFSKHAVDLTYLEAATIAGITQSPTAYDPVRNPEASEGRRNIVLRLMNEQGYITQEEYDAGIAAPIAATLVVSEAQSGCMAAGNVVQGSGYFCDYVTNVIRNDPAFGETADEREERLYRGGLTITTTLDPRLQTEADTEVKNGVPVDDGSAVGSAISVVEPGTGQIKAMAQNRTYNNTAEATGRDTSVNYNTSYSYGGSGGFAPGSTFKPFTLLEWLKQGHSLSERVNGSVRPLNENQFTACGSKGINNSWTPGNSEGGASASMTILDATRNSVNLAYLTMAMQLDLCAIMDGAAALGVTQSPSGVEGEPFNAYPANVLGSDSTTPLALAGAYAAFASGGVYCKPIAITNVKDADGADLPVPDAGCQQAIDPEVARSMNYALSNVWNGTAKSLGAPQGYTASGKTGTTSRNEQTWFVGYTPRLVSAVWVGFPDSFTPMQRITINGRYIPYVFGATVAGATWKRFMDQALADGQPNPGFDQPSSESVYGRAIPIPSVVGKDQNTAINELRAAGFSASVGGTTASDITPGSVVSQSPSGSAPAGSSITLTLSSGPAAPAPGTDPNAGGANPGGGNAGGGGGGNGNGGNG